MAISDSQREINEAEWRNPDNWSGGWLHRVYFSKRDSRLWVGIWWNNTVGPTMINLGHRWGPSVFSLVVAVGLLVAMFVAWQASRFYLKT